MAGAALILGIAIGVLVTLGVQDLKRKIRRRIRKLTRPQVRGQIKNGRRVR